MDKVLNLGIPHVGEKIFSGINNRGLIQCMLVSQTWKVLAGNVLLKRSKGKILRWCRRGETTVVQLLMDHFNSEESGLNARDTDGLTPFHWACYRGHTEIVKLLLEHSGSTINLNAKDDLDITAFMLACQRGRKDVVELLLKYSDSDIELNLSLNAKNYAGWTGFMYACMLGRKDVVKLILDYPESSIELNTEAINGRTAFMMACRNGHKDVVKLLLEHSKDVDTNIPIHFKIQHVSKEIRNLIKMHPK